MNYPSPWEYAMPAQPVPEGVDWDMWCGPTEPVPYNENLYIPRPTSTLVGPGWLSFRSYSGGEMTGWGAHGFDMVQAALGMDAAGPSEIWTEGPKYAPPKYIGPQGKELGDKICSVPKVFFRYPSGAVMELVEKGPSGEKLPSFGGIFIGEKGAMSIDRGRIASTPDELAENLMRQRPRGFDDNNITNWLDCIRSRKLPNADIEIGHRSATVCHLGNIARWTGRKLKWNSEREIFPDDPAANTLLDRPRRQPWELPKSV